MLQNLFSHDVSKGVVTPLFASTAPRAECLNGKVSCTSRRYLVPFDAYADTVLYAQLLGPNVCVTDIPAAFLARGAGEALWDWSDAQAECFEDAANNSYEIMN